MEKIQIPQREVIQIKQFVNKEDYLTSRNKFGKNKEQLKDVLRNKAQNYTASPRDRFDSFVFVAQEMDTIRTAQDMFDMLKQECIENAILLNPRFSVEHVSEFLNTRKLITSAKKYEYWSMPKIRDKVPGEIIKYVIDIVLKIIGVFVGLLGLIPEEQLRAIITAELLKTLLMSSIRNLRIACVLIFAIVFLKTVSDWKKLRADTIKKIDKQIGELDEESFRNFIDGFSDRDFRFPKGFRGYKQETMFVCAMSEYTFKERCVLHRHWMTSTEKQFWCIFQEVQHQGFAFTTEKNEKRNCFVYRIEKLSQDQKRAILEQTGRTRIYAPAQDYGVDYLLKEEKHVIISRSEDITPAIEHFREIHPEFACLNLRELMFLITDLGRNLKIDMSIRQNRDAIFAYNPGREPYRELERKLEVAVLFQTRRKVSDDDFRLIPKAVGELRQYFSVWPEFVFENEAAVDRNMEYIQLSILKAISNGNTAGMRDVFLRISDRIINEFDQKEDYPEQYRTRDWVVILQRVIEVFHVRNYRVFLPMLLYQLLWICEGSILNRPNQICAVPSILEAARDNLFINHNTDVLGFSPIDAVRDHYRVVSLAVRELNPAYNLEQSNRAPDSFSLLNLKEKERASYFNALVYLEENAVIKLYEYLYDLYCGTVYDVRTMRLLNGANLYNEVQRKYPGRDGKAQEKDTLLQAILEQVMEHVQNMYNKDQEVAGALLELWQAWNLHEQEKHERMLFLLTKYELRGLSVVSLLLCMSAQITGSRELVKQIYMDFGNDLFRLVFLTYHKTVLGNIYHDDIVYLLRIILGYVNPSGILLGYLDWISSHALPNAVRRQVDDYLMIHKSLYVERIRNSVDKLSRNDVEEFIAYVESTKSLQEPEVNSIFSVLMESLQKRYPADNKMDILLVLLSMLTNQGLTERFANKTAEQILKELNEMEPDTVYLFYKKALEYDKKRFLNACPVVAVQILNSNFVANWTLIAEYIQHAKDMESKEYVETAKTYISTLRLVSKRESLITPIILIVDCIEAVIEHLHRLYLRNPAIFNFANTNTKDLLFFSLENTRTQIIQIETRAEYRQRLLNRNGIVVYLHYLIQNSGLKSCSTEEYHIMSQEEKEVYLTQNYIHIRPFLTSDHSCINQEYRDMLRMLLEGGNSLESMANQFEWLLRMAKDCKEVVTVLMRWNTVGREEIHGMLDDYIAQVKQMNSNL